MATPEIFTYKDIAPEHLSGESSGRVLGSDKLMRDVSATLFYELGMRFLQGPIAEKHHEHDHVYAFCQTLQRMYCDEGQPYLAEDWSIGDDTVRYAYDHPIDTDFKKAIHRRIQQQLLDNISFSHDRQHYVLGQGLQNLDKIHATKDAAGKKDALNYVQNNYAISIATIPYASGILAHAGAPIEDDVYAMYQQVWIDAEYKSLRENFGTETLEHYIHGLAGEKDINALYEAELKDIDGKPRKLAILASIIAYKTHDKKLFSRLMMRKTGHINQIAQNIVSHINTNIQSDFHPTYAIIRDRLWYTFNHRLIEYVYGAFYLPGKVQAPSTINSRRAQKYKKAFYRALDALDRADLSSEHINTIIELEEDNKDLFQLSTRNTDKELTNWVVIEASKFSRDYELITKPEALVQYSIFSMPENELLAYIEKTDFGLLKCCAIWRYMFLAPNLYMFNERLEKFATVLKKHSDFGIGLEETMNETYEGLAFNVFNIIQITALLLVAKQCEDDIHNIISVTEEMYYNHKDSYPNEFAFLLDVTQKLLVKNIVYEQKTALADAYDMLIEELADDAGKGDDDENGEEARW